MLGNHGDGRSRILTVALSKRYDMELDFQVSYAWQDVEAVTEGFSSRGISNWRNIQDADRNRTSPRTSPHQVTHSVKLNLGYERGFGRGFRAWLITQTGYEHPLAQLLAVSHRAMRARRLTLNSPSNAQELVHTYVFTNGGVLAKISRSDCVAMTDMATADLPAANPPPGPRPTRLFRNGNSQAVRIPSALAFESDKTQVEIERRGDELVIRPVKRRLSGLGSAFRELGPYFDNFRREQPPMEVRDWESRKPKP